MWLHNKRSGTSATAAENITWVIPPQLVLIGTAPIAVGGQRIFCGASSEWLRSGAVVSLGGLYNTNTTSTSMPFWALFKNSEWMYYTAKFRWEVRGCCISLSTTHTIISLWGVCKEVHLESILWLVCTKISAWREKRERLPVRFRGAFLSFLKFSLGDPSISHLEISGHSFISWVFYLPLSPILHSQEAIATTYHCPLSRA
jgi:hypothetical protein